VKNIYEKNGRFMINTHSFGRHGKMCSESYSDKGLKKWP
jgi:hypothetical protein